MSSSAWSSLPVVPITYTRSARRLLLRLPRQRLPLPTLLEWSARLLTQPRDTALVRPRILLTVAVDRVAVATEAPPPRPPTPTRTLALGRSHPMPTGHSTQSSR